jgi:hypothetical protein
VHTADALLATLRSRGNQVTAEAGGRLAVAGGQPLTDDLRDAIRASKSDLLDVLAGETELFEERASIREYDSGLIRTTAERLARLDVERILKAAALGAPDA